MPDKKTYEPRYGAIYPSLADRVVLVSGGGSGIGESIVRHFAAQGAKVGFIDLNEETSRALLADLKGEKGSVHYEHADLTDIDALRQAIDNIRKALGPITILVNNAANDQRTTVSAVTSDDWDWSQAVNVKHQFFCAQAVHKDMVENGGGAIVNMSSISVNVATGELTPYATAKAAVFGLTHTLAREFGADNIRVNCVLPGWIMTQRQLDLWVTPETEVEIENRQCLKRKLYPRRHRPRSAFPGIGRGRRLHQSALRRRWRMDLTALPQDSGTSSGQVRH